MFREEDFQQEPTDAFAGVDFTAPPTVSSDSIVAALSAGPSNATNYGQGNTPILRPSAVAAKNPGQAGVDRVNKDTANTGVVGYKDSKGQTVLTNVAKDPNTGADTPLLRASAPAQKLSTGFQPVTTTTATFLSQIQNAKDASEALANFDAFNASAAQGKTQIEQNALEFANNKLGVGTLQRQLMESEAADKADPAWYPGIGDSPITAKVRAEMQSAISSAQTEAKNFLQTNMTYASLNNSINSAKLAYTDAERRFNAKEQKDYNAQIRSDAKIDAQAQKDNDNAALIDAQTLARMQTLFPGDFDNAVQNGKDPKLAAYSLMRGNSKNKDLEAAITTDGDKLLALATSGNAYATTLIAAQEASKMPGISTDAVKTQIAAMAKRIDNTDKLLKDWAKTQNDPKAAGGMAAMLEGLKDNKHEVTQRKIRMLMDINSVEQTQKFVGDVSSWGSSDPVLQTAIQTARKTTANPSLENVLTAYVGDKQGQDRAIAIKAFRDLAKDNASKYSESMFGMPNYRVAEGAINKWAAQGIIGKTWDKAKSLNALDVYSMTPLPFVNASGAVAKTGQALWGMVNAPNPSQIDPDTGKKFGE